MQNFSDRLEMAIQRSHKPKGDLAEHCGVALSTVSRWLAGAAPKPETLERIALYLNVDAKWLVYGGEDLADDAKDQEPVALRDDPAVYRVSRPLRAVGEPSMTERLAAIEENGRAMLESLEMVRKSLDELTDLFINRKPKE